MQTKAEPTPDPTVSQDVPAAAAPDEHPQRPVLDFARHYAEMVVAMLLGMFVLGFALVAVLELVGVDASDWDVDAPALYLLTMVVTMTIPMVWWMRYRGHRWRLAWEMTAAMFLPAVAAIGLLWTDVENDVHMLMGLEHTAMFTAMFVAMFLRRHEYTGH